MQLFNVSLNNGLRNFTHYITNTDETTFTPADLNASLNMYYSFVVNEVIDSMDGWDFQGEIATSTLISGQQEYVFPSDLIKIKRVEVTYDGINWYRAESFDINERSKAIDTVSIAQNFVKQQPYFDLNDNSLFLFPIPDANVTAGLKIWYEKEIVDLIAVTDEPAFGRAYHKILCHGAAKDYFARNAEKQGYALKMQSNDGEFQKILERMKNFYQKKTQDNHYELTPAYINYDYGSK